MVEEVEVVVDVEIVVVVEVVTDAGTYSIKAHKVETLISGVASTT